MKTVTKTICSLMIAILVMAFMGTSVFATENGNVWLNATEPEDGKTVVSIVTDAVVADGLVVLTYDAANLEYTSLEVNSDCVAVYSVNANTAGTIKLAWVAPGAYEAENAVCVITLTFKGVSEAGVTLSGECADAEGNAVVIRDALDTTALVAAIAEANGLDPAAYTRDSYEQVEAALTAAEAVLADVTATQAQVDAAAAALKDAIAALVIYDVDNSELKKAVLMASSLEAVHYTEESFQSMQTALADAKAVLESRTPTQEEVDNATQVLLDAVEALVLAKSDAGQTLNFNELEKAILKAKALNRYDYTKASFAAVEAALGDAEAILADTTATQEAVDAAAHTLNMAIRGLVLSAGVPDTGLDFMTVPFIALVVLSAAGVVVTVCLLNSKKGRCAK